MKTRYLFPLLTFLTLNGAAAFGQTAIFDTNTYYRPGSLDRTFPPGDLRDRDGNPLAEPVALRLQADGKILLAGIWNVRQPDGSSRQRADLLRFNADGSDDDTFRLQVDFGEKVSDVLVQPDGRILVSSNFWSVGRSRSRLARLNADGSLDRSFVPAIESFFVKLQSDWRIIVGHYDETNRIWELRRLNTDGSADAAYRVNLDGSANSAIQSDGKLVLSGAFTRVNGVERPDLVRLNIDGTLDESFKVPPDLLPSLRAGFHAIGIAHDGKILVGASTKGIVRLHSDGSLDTSFKVEDPWIDDLFIEQSNGKWLVREHSDSPPYLMRLNSDGSTDSSFRTLRPGLPLLGSQSDGKLIAFGSYSDSLTNVFGLLRLHGGELPEVAFRSITRTPSGETQLTLQALPGFRYWFEASSDLKAWSSVGSRDALGEEPLTLSFVDRPSVVFEKLFYRVRRTAQ